MGLVRWLRAPVGSRRPAPPSFPPGKTAGRTEMDPDGKMQRVVVDLRVYEDGLTRLTAGDWIGPAQLAGALRDIADNIESGKTQPIAHGVVKETG